MKQLDIVSTKVKNPQTGQFESIFMGGVNSGGGTSDYSDLNNKPSINNVVLEGNKTLSQLGIAAASVNGYAELDSNSNLNASILSGDIPSNIGATTQPINDNSTKIATTQYVDRAISNLPKPMILKGTLGQGGTTNSLPIDGSAEIGDTYKVITAGTYDSQQADIGDLFVCLTKTSFTNSWLIIPSGDDIDEVLYAALAKEIDEGAKNVLPIYFETFTHSCGITVKNNGDGTITLNGTNSQSSQQTLLSNFEAEQVAGISLEDGENYTFSGTGNSNCLIKCSTTIAPIRTKFNTYQETQFIFNKASDSRLTFDLIVAANASFTNYTFTPMVCLTKKYVITDKKVPYAKNNQSLTKAAVQVEKNTKVIQSLINQGVKSFLSFESFPIDSSTFSITLEKKIPAGDYILTYTNSVSTGTSTFKFYDNEDNEVESVSIDNNGNGIEEPISFSDDVWKIQFRSTIANTLTDLMIVDPAIYSFDKNYVEAGMTNQDIVKKLDTIDEGAEVNVQANWTQTNSSADDFIKNKPVLGTAASLDVDADLSSTSTNPVQNKAVQAPIARLVDSGAKNRAKVTSGSETAQWIDFEVDSMPSGDVVLSIGLLASTDTDASTCQIGIFDSNNQNIIRGGSYPQISRGTNSVWSGSITGTAAKVRVYSSDTTAHGVGDTVTVSNLMLCTDEDYSISTEFVPYAPSNRELYEEVETKASLEDILGAGTTITNNANMDSLTDIGKWYCVNAPTAVTVTNAPFTDAAYFGWTIRSIASSDRYVQIAIKNSDDFVIAKRRYSGVWSAWSYLTGTAAT